MTDTATKFQEQLNSQRPVLVVEVAPPNGGDPAPLRARAGKFAGSVHAVSVSDNRHGICQSSLAAAAILAGEGFEPILHVATRDRNRMALISTCLGAQALGIRNIFCTSGTHQTLGICPSAKSVFDIDSIQLIDLLTKLGTGAAAPYNLSGVARFCLGGVAAPYADPADLQLMRLEKKINVGAKFLITQPVFDLDRFGTWWENVTQRGIQDKTAILAGIEPLLDAEKARIYAASRPNPMAPEAILNRLSSSGNKTAQRAAGIELAVETVQKLSTVKGLRGFQISAEEDGDAALEIIERAGLEV